MKSKINNIFFLIFLLFIFSPIFLSISKSNEITFARFPGIGSFYGTLPLSAFLIYILLLILLRKLNFQKIELILLLFCSVFILLSINFSNLVVLKNYIGLVTFISSNILFMYIFTYLYTNKSISNFNNIFIFFFYLYFVLVIYSFIYDYTSPIKFFISQNIVVFNYTNYYPLTLYVFLVFFYSYFRLNIFIFILFLSIVYINIIISTSIISEIIFYSSLFYYIIYKFNLIKILFNNFSLLLILIFMLIIIFAYLINPFTIENHNIYFRLMIINYYLNNIDFINFIFPLSSFAAFNYSDHNQYFGFLAYGGIIFFTLVIIYIVNLLKKFFVTQNLFIFTIFLILLIGCMVQNFYTNIYFGILLSFLLNYSYFLKKE